jgi:hypothetical protein
MAIYFWIMMENSVCFWCLLFFLSHLKWENLSFINIKYVSHSLFLFHPFNICLGNTELLLDIVSFFEWYCKVCYNCPTQLIFLKYIWWGKRKILHELNLPEFIWLKNNSWISAGRATDLQVWGPEFKLQSHQKEKNNLWIRLHSEVQKVQRALLSSVSHEVICGSHWNYVENDLDASLLMI